MCIVGRVLPCWRWFHATRETEEGGLATATALGAARIGDARCCLLHAATLLLVAVKCAVAIEVGALAPFLYHCRGYYKDLLLVHCPLMLQTSGQNYVICPPRISISRHPQTTNTQHPAYSQSTPPAQDEAHFPRRGLLPRYDPQVRPDVHFFHHLSTHLIPHLSPSHLSRSSSGTAIPLITTNFIPQSVPHYPEEDAKLRATSLTTRRGGNCPNSLQVLTQLLPPSEATLLSLHLISCLPDPTSPATSKIKASFTTPVCELGDGEVRGGERVDLSRCIYRAGVEEAASSFIIRSAETGSRTIVNYNGLDEMTIDEFKAVVEGACSETEESWWHFEVG